MGLGGRVHQFLRKAPDEKSLIALRFRDAKLSIHELKDRTHLVDLQNEESFLKALDDLSLISKDWIVIHLAAVINAQGDTKAQEEVNFKRTTQLIEWANKNAKSFIYTSSVVAFGATPNAITRNEANYPNYHFLNKLDGYSLSKRKAHDEVLRTSKINTCILCPGIIHGSYEHAKSSRAHLKKVLEDKVTWLPSGGGSFVSLEYVTSEIILSALNEPIDKEIKVKILAECYLRYPDYLNLCRESAGMNAKKFKIIPHFFLWIAVTLYFFIKIFKIDTSLLSKFIQAQMFYYFETLLTKEEGLQAIRKALKESHEHKN
jgi:nucleoside-diphosphate-sugar epimerase